MMGAVRAELRAGRKRSHWMWFIFPQLRGLSMSSTAHRYGLEGVEEARAYLAHPVLGARLRECCALLLQSSGGDIHAILGSPDDMKLRSCLTLFLLAAPQDPLFQQCLQRYYAGEADPRTLAMCVRP